VILITEANAVEGGTTSATWLYAQHYQSRHNWWHDSDVTFC